MRLHQNDERMPATTMAVFIDAGYLTSWPHEWTRRGVRSIHRHSAGRNFRGNDVLQEALRSGLIERHFTAAGVSW